MIRKVHIQNFKSLADFEMELGRVNVIIGANGSGKTNILEGIAMGAAAAAEKLDYEFLGARLRTTSPDLMKTGFPGNASKEIKISFWPEAKNSIFDFVLEFDSQEGQQWRNVGKFIVDRNRRFDRIQELFVKIADSYEKFEKPDSKDKAESNILIAQIQMDTSELAPCSKFLIFSPENHFLRRFEEPSQIYPLGIRGEGLFHELKRIFTDTTKTAQQEEIKEHLQLLGWFEDFSIPNGLMSMEYKIAIKDRFLDPKLAAFDQRSANEGFLMLLFYLVLFTSENTPKFFAIENIDTAFNPKMCREIMRLITELAVKHEKQVIVTTHNPWTLDGLSLTDDEQRLFVARRNKHGHTKVERITQKADSNLMLSEIWTRGYFGGLPDNF
jgi:predicted ATPase